MSTDSVVSGQMYKLGRLIKISPKAVLHQNKPGRKQEFLVPTVEMTIGIGKNNHATLIMTLEDLAALKLGDPIHITTAQDIKKGLK